MAKRKHSEQDVDTSSAAPVLDASELKDMKAQAKAAIASSANAKIDIADDAAFDGDVSFVTIGDADPKKRLRKDGKEKVK